MKTKFSFSPALYKILSKTFTGNFMQERPDDNKIIRQAKIVHMYQKQSTVKQQAKVIALYR